jgi:putative aldouronate transport system substrate-binding protein
MSLPGEVSDPDLSLVPYDPPVEVSFARETSSGLWDLLKQFPGETLEDNRWTRLYEKDLGIRIKNEWTAEGELYRQKLGFSVASGQIPDIVQVDAQQLRRLSNAGAIQDLTAAYDQYASALTQQILGEEGTASFDAATIDGKLMGIPKTASFTEGAKYLWIRTDWLDTLGLKPPQTMEELLAISAAFTHNDPDRNGEDDTYGLALSNYLWDPVGGVAAFLAGYGAYPLLWLDDGSGSLKYGGIQPEVKVGLKVLQDMYHDGQIDSEFSLKEGNKVKKDVAAGKMGMVFGEQWASFWIQASREQNPNAEWRAFPIVSVSGKPVQVPLPFATKQFYAVKKNYAHPEAIVKMVNLHLEKNWGATADYNTYYSTPYPAWSLSPVTPAPGNKNYDAYRQLEQARQTGDYSGLNEEAQAIRSNIDAYLNDNQELGWGWEQTYGPSGAFAVLDQYMKKDQLLYDRFVGSPTATMLEKQSILHELEYEAFIKIIMGNSIDGFDEFVEEWRRLGGDQMTAEVNQWAVDNNN